MKPKQASKVEPAGRFSGLESLPIEVTVRVGGARCRLGRLSELKAGDLIELDRRVGEPFELCAEGILLARVDPVAEGDGIAVKIVEVPEEENGPGR